MRGAASIRSINTGQVGYRTTSGEIKKGFGFSLCALFATALIALAPQSLSAAAATAFLHTQGQDIVNEEGDKVLLRGVGLGNWMLPEGDTWKFGAQGDRPRKLEKLVNDLIGPENGKRFWSEFRTHYITEADIRRIAKLGCNSVRPALNSRLFLSESGTPTGTEEGFLLMDNLVSRCKAHAIRLEKCVFLPDVVKAMLRWTPGRIEGENFEPAGPNRSYLVSDPNRLSKYYRQSAPVAIIGRETAHPKESDQNITLNAKEWTAYSIASESSKDYQVTIKVKTAGSPAAAQLISGNQVRQVTITQNGWKEIKLDAINLNRGMNHLKFVETRGGADLDWIELRLTEKSRPAAH